MIDKLDMFQSTFGKIDEFGWWDLERVSADADLQIYLNVVQRTMPNLWGSLDVRSSGTSVNERTDRSDIENFAYNCTLTYGTC